MFSSSIIFGMALDFGDYATVANYEDVFIGICAIIYSVWCCIESVVGIIKIANIINKKEKEKEEKGE